MLRVGYPSQTGILTAPCGNRLIYDVFLLPQSLDSPVEIQISAAIPAMTATAKTATYSVQNRAVAPWSSSSAPTSVEASAGVFALH